MSDRDFDELSAARALNALTPADEKAFDDALAARPERRERVDEDAETAARLGEIAEEVVPPPFVRDALLARITVTPQETPAASPPSEPDDASAPGHAHVPGAEGETPGATGDRRSRRRRSRAVRGWFALAASLVLVVGIGGVVALVSERLNQPESVVALVRIEEAPDAQTAAASVEGGGEATLHWSESLGEAVLVTDGLPEIADDQDFELWYVRDGAPIAAGVFSAADGEATALLSGDMRPGDLVAVTVEPAGGSPEGVPTSEPILAIATA